jgi:hypothetical protein
VIHLRQTQILALAPNPNSKPANFGHVAAHQEMHVSPKARELRPVITPDRACAYDGDTKAGKVSARHLAN